MHVLPISFGGGIVGTVATGILQSVAGGAVFFSGYALAGAIVDYTVGSATEVAADPTSFRAKWGRPLAFASIAGIVGGIVAWVGGSFKLKNKGLLAALAAAGPGVRAFGGLVKALVPAETLTATGLVGDIGRAAVGLSDFLQLSDFMQLRGSGGDHGVSGFGENESFGLGENESFSLGDDDEAMSDAGLCEGSDDMEEVGIF